MASRTRLAPVAVEDVLNEILTLLQTGIEIHEIIHCIDICDRWTRQLGQVDLQRYIGAPCGLANPIDVQTVFGGVVVDPRARTWNLNNTVDSVAVSPVLLSTWDISDRWARQLGQIDLARVLGAALSAGNPVIAGIFDAAGNRMPSMDAYARRGYIEVSSGTRTTTKVQPEREDLLIYSEDVAAVGAGDTELLAAVGGQKHKIYACGYESDAAVRVGFRFGAGSTFCRRSTAGPFAQTFVQPMIGAANTALNFNVSGAVNAYTWIAYVTEA